MTSGSARRVAFFGGSFDPPHVAHVLLANYALLTLPIDEVLVVPVFEHAFGKRLAPFEDRLRLCQLAFAACSAVRVSAIECELPRPSYTLHTLQRLSVLEPGAELRLLVGSDVVAETRKWHAFQEVTRIAPLLVVERAGHAGQGALLPELSSSRVRELFGRRDEHSLGELSRLVPRAVLSYVLDHGLYAEVLG